MKQNSTMGNNEFSEQSKQRFDYELGMHILNTKAMNIVLWDVNLPADEPLSPDTTVIYTDEYRQYFGYEDENDFPNLLSSWLDNIHPEDKDGVSDAFFAHIDDRTGNTPYDVVFRFMRKDGQYIYIRGIGESLRDEDGKALRIAGSMEDITERVLTARELEHRDALLDAVNRAAAILLNTDTDSFDTTLYKGMEVLAQAVGADRMYIWKNHTIDGELYCTQVHEWSEGAEPQQGNMYTMDIPYSENIQGLEELLSNGKCLNGIVREMDAGYQAQLVPQGIVSIIIVPVFLKDAFWGFVGFDDCHNERIFTGQEESILRSASLMFAYAYQRSEVLQNLHEISVQLEKAVVELEQNSRYKTDFLARMSHEIRTPVNAIMGMSELALRESTPEAKDEYIHTVIRAGHNLTAIIDGILDISKIEAGKMEISPYEYSVLSLLSDVVDIIKMNVAGTKVRFVVKADRNIPQTLYGDVTKIRQVALNILNNAVKYTQIGYVSLCIYTAPAVSADTVNLVFEVTDTGMGIKQEDLGKLFGDFARFDLEKNRGIEGTGLGLVITRSIVEAMGGSINVESEYGRGSTFTITIPQKICSNEPLARVEGPEDKSVLVYERRAMSADSIIYSVDNHGVRHTLVSNGNDLRKSLNNRAYDFLFIPYELWEENKDTVLNYGKNIKTVMLTEFGKNVPKHHQNILAMPAYTTHIADILNEVERKSPGTTDAGAVISFTAPAARVLVVDDILTNLKVAEGLLKPYKMQIDTCSCGKDAIEAVRNAESTNRRYDFVFMDHKMPGMDGVEVTKHIREMGTASSGDGTVKNDPYYLQVPIIALTANVVSGTDEMFIENGFNDILSKPINIARLDKILVKWLPKDKQLPPVASGSAAP